jgi:hypothetical protein
MATEEDLIKCPLDGKKKFCSYGLAGLCSECQDPKENPSIRGNET